MSSDGVRQLPSVNTILEMPARRAQSERNHAATAAAVRAELAELRHQLLNGGAGTGYLRGEAIASRVAERLRAEERPRLRGIINATGIILHTNLGRAPLAEPAARAAYDAARGYLNLELDLESGKRSSRQDAVRHWLCRLTGAESATVVNNNAAATIIVLRALCQGKEALLSRGQLIEIGGSFRMPEIMSVSGAILREVGATNITRIG
ncbi:MAG: L-seryl-tRNA(Sec) selenium transferase, partial [Candidatus Acidiferrum sp.]